MKRKDIIKSNEISELYTFTLGGYPQKVLIEGKQRDLPVVITLHGGPGTPIPFSVGCRGLFPDFTDHFIMVYWDQLGCGINNRTIDERFTIAAFVKMTRDLIDEVRRIFPENPVYLFSTSWGSILSALTADMDAVQGVVCCGQIVKQVFFNDVVMQTLEQSAIPQKKLSAIRSIRKEAITDKEMQLISGSIGKYTYGYTNPNGSKAPMGSIIWGLLTSPDYSLRDFKAIMVNGYRGNVSLWKEILALDLSETLRHVKIPYVMLQGDTDCVAATKFVQELTDNSGNPHLQCQVIENCGHMPSRNMMDTVYRALLDLTKEHSDERKKPKETEGKKRS